MKLEKLKEFKNHPFKVIRNAELDELMESIEKDGVIVPLLARSNKVDKQSRALFLQGKNFRNRLEKVKNRYRDILE